MKNIAVFISGSGTNLQQIIDKTNSNEINAKIKIVISDNCKAYGLERAVKANIKTECVNSKKIPNKDDRTEYLIKILDDNNIDLIVLAGYLSIISKEIVKKYSKKIINIHPSLIPKYCGKGFYGDFVHKAVLENKEKVTGVTVHYVDEEIDTGEIILQEVIEILEDDTIESLANRIHKVEHKKLCEE